MVCNTKTTNNCLWFFSFILFSLSFGLISGCANYHLSSQDSQQDQIDENTLAELTESIISFSDTESLTIDQAKLSEASLKYQLEATQLLEKLISNHDLATLQFDDAFKARQKLASPAHNEKTKGTFANKLSLYLSDPRFACSNPIFTDYFNHRYQKETALYKTCHEAIPFSVITKDNGVQTRWVEPEKVSEVHLLFAGNDDGLISRFGHTLLRLVICPDKSNDKGDCDSNLYQHLTLGFQAHVNEFNIDTLKGLMGSYQAYLYAEEFMSIYRQYAISEFRDLYSLPLTLSTTQKDQLLRGLSQIHWSFSGDYKFLTQNCSTLLQDTFKIIWPNYAQSKMNEKNRLRPDSFFEDMKDQPLTRAIVFDDLSFAEQTGHYFPSTEPLYKQAFDIVKAARSQSEFEDLDDYLKILPQQREQEINQDQLYYSKLKNNTHLLGAQILLEELSAIQSRTRMQANIASFFDQHGIENIRQYMSQNLNKHSYEVFTQCIATPLESQMQPKKLKAGIPSLEIMTGQKNTDTIANCESSQNWSAINDINLAFDKYDTDSWMPFKVAMHFWLGSLDNVIKLMELTK